MNKKLIIITLIVILINHVSLSSPSSSPSSSSSSSWYNIIDVNKNANHNKYCIIQYVNELNNHTAEDSYYRAVNMTGNDPINYCDSKRIQQNVTDSIAVISYTDKCPIASLAETFKSLGASALLISIGCDIDISTIVFNDTINLTIAIIADTNTDKIFGVNPDETPINMTIKFFPIQLASSIKFDMSMIVIWLMATFTVIVGSYWSGHVRAMLFHKTREAKRDDNDQTITVNGQKGSSADEEPFVNVSPLWIIGFVIGMALMLLALYFFFKYLVYLIIALFTIASIASLYACGDVLLKAFLPLQCQRWSFVCTKKCGSIAYYQLILLMLSVSTAAFWVVIRREPYSWSLQNILGICFSMNMLRTIRLPSCKICVILLSLLFFYDIFFVFITPLFTAKGNSVMVDVATGGQSKSRCGRSVGEQLPMLLRVPHLLFNSDSNDPIDICFPSRDSLLGFGDILVPGLLVSYCHAFDLIYRVKYRLYYLTASVSYGLGLIATFIGLYLMEGTAQPALLYLVPFTVIPTLLIACYRKEFKPFWCGPENIINDENPPLDGQIGHKLSVTDDHREENLLIPNCDADLPKQSTHEPINVNNDDPFVVKTL